MRVNGATLPLDAVDCRLLLFHRLGDRRDPVALLCRRSIQIATVEYFAGRGVHDI